MDTITKYEHPLWGFNIPPVNKSNPVQRIIDDRLYESVKQELMDFFVSGNIQPNTHVNAFFKLQRVEEYEVSHQVPEVDTLHSHYAAVFDKLYPTNVPLWKRMIDAILNLFKST